MKRCCKCNQTLPLDDFYRWSRGRDGYQVWCKACDKAYKGTPGRKAQKNATERRSFKKKYDSNREYVNEAKSEPCMDCGLAFPPCAMDFDHRDPSTKEFNVGSMMRWSKKKIQEEIDKCDLVCSNCHRVRTHGCQ